jgi:hypothetical protein
MAIGYAVAVECPAAERARKPLQASQGVNARDTDRFHNQVPIKHIVEGDGFAPITHEDRDMQTIALVSSRCRIPGFDTEARLIGREVDLARFQKRIAPIL